MRENRKAENTHSKENLDLVSEISVLKSTIVSLKNKLITVEEERDSLKLALKIISKELGEPKVESNTLNNQQNPNNSVEEIIAST